MRGPLNLLMGIINITPDSFSDGGEYNLSNTFNERLLSFLKHPQVAMIDIGAESTAPFNQSVSEETELLRFKESLIPFLEQHDWVYSKTLSLDTQKLSTIKYMVATLNKKIDILWNDISGCLDDETLTFLKINKQLKLVLTHNFSQKRDDSINHIHFVQNISDEELFGSVVNFFETAKVKLLKSGIDPSRVYFDPGLGFAKNRPQNLYLMKKLAALIKVVNHPYWLIGISRKSFLRDVGFERSKDAAVILQSELKLVNYLKNLNHELKECSSLSIAHRVHDPNHYLSII